MSQTNEHAFETYVEEILLTRGGWTAGSVAEWDKERALFPPQVFAFIQDTQPALWKQMKELHAAGLEPLLINTLVKELDAKGSLYVLRHGFKFYGKTFHLAYFKPAHGANEEILEQFGKNRLSRSSEQFGLTSDRLLTDQISGKSETVLRWPYLASMYGILLPERVKGARDR